MQNNLQLARKIESTVAKSHIAYVQSYNRLSIPALAEGLAIAGGYAAFAGAEDVLTQAIGIGLAGAVSEKQWEELEQFYWSRQASVALELCPLAHESVLSLLNKHQYNITQYSSLLYLDAENLTIPPAKIETVITQDRQLWAKIVAEGFIETGTIPPSLLHTFTVFASIPEVNCFLALIDGKPAGGAATGIYNQVADLGFASTLPQWRGRGVQKSLLATRLAYAKLQKCTLAISTAEPGSISAQNLEKTGFKMAYTRTKFEKAPK